MYAAFADGVRADPDVLLQLVQIRELGWASVHLERTWAIRCHDGLWNIKRLNQLQQSICCCLPFKNHPREDFRPSFMITFTLGASTTEKLFENDFFVHLLTGNDSDPQGNFIMWSNRVKNVLNYKALIKTNYLLNPKRCLNHIFGQSILFVKHLNLVKLSLIMNSWFKFIILYFNQFFNLSKVLKKKVFIVKVLNEL